MHGKKLVNGTSGYQSPTYREMRRRMWDFPSRPGIEDLRALGVRRVIVHPCQYLEFWPEFEPRFADLASDLELVAEVDGALVFEMRNSTWLTRDELNARRRGLGSASIPRDDWTVTASETAHLAELAIDGDVSTRWNTDAQKPGDFYQVDFGRQVEFDRVVTHLNSHPREYPRGYRIEVSDDDVDWETVAEEADLHVTVSDLVDRRLEIRLPATRARYLRLVQTGRSPGNEWTIHELDVRRNTDAGG